MASELIAAAGLALAVEGLFYGGFPNAARRMALVRGAMVAAASSAPESPQAVSKLPNRKSKVRQTRAWNMATFYH